MASAVPNPIPTDFHRRSIRLPQPFWIGVAAIVLLAAGGGLRIAMPIYRQQAAIREIERLGGDVECARGGPDWLRERLGEEPIELFDTVIRVSLSDTATSDESLDHLRGLARLRQLDLDGTRITNAGLARLEELRALESLSLSETKITDRGLAHLQRLTNLQVLFVGRTSVTDSGIAELKRSLPNIRVSMVLRPESWVEAPALKIIPMIRSRKPGAPLF